METEIIETEYTELLNTAIAQINGARNSLALQLNATVNSTYWNLGKLLHDRKIEGGYGSSVINRLSVDLKMQFPDMGLSPRNLWYMKRFYERYFAVSKKLQRCVAVLQSLNDPLTNCGCPRILPSFHGGNRNSFEI